MEYQELGGIKYHIKGSSPQLVIHSGTHGDEYHVIEPLREVVEKMYDSLPSFLYVPEVSPSAVRLRTRVNERGNDLNRIFGTQTDDPEVIANKQILQKVRNAVAMTFHEDTGIEQFYLYDSTALQETQLRDFRQKILNTGIELYTGIDDPEDDNLNCQIENGYFVTSHIGKQEGPFVDDWAVFNGYVRRMMTIEIPYQKQNFEYAIEACLELGCDLVSQYAHENDDFVLQYTT